MLFKTLALAVVALASAVTVVQAQDETAVETCTPNGGTYLIKTKTNAALFPTTCNIVKGNVDVTCTLDALVAEGGLESLSFMENVHTIEGWLRIVDCDKLASLDSLAKLRTINGDPTRGLTIRNNDLLEHMKGLENLASIPNGGVDVFLNDKMCYVDLMKWERIVGGAETRDSALIKYEFMPASCMKLECDSDCSCGYCGGPGACEDDCSPASLLWIIAPVLIGVILLVILLVWCYKQYKNDKLGCKCFCTVKDPVRKVKPAPALPSQPATKQFAVEPTAEPAFASPAQPQVENVAVAPLVPASDAAPVNATNNILDAGKLESEAESEDDTPCICGKPAEFDCSRCGQQGYCSTECQRGDWKQHREACKAAAAAKTAAAKKATASADKEDDLGECVVCKKPASFECSRCGGPAYCSATCQRQHWREHSPECKKATRGASIAASKPATVTASSAEKSEITAANFNARGGAELQLPATTGEKAESSV